MRMDGGCFFGRLSCLGEAAGAVCVVQQGGTEQGRVLNESLGVMVEAAVEGCLVRKSTNINTK